MCKTELWVGGGGDTHTSIHTHTHINTMTRPGLGAGPSEKHLESEHCPNVAAYKTLLNLSRCVDNSTCTLSLTLTH